MTEAEEIMNSTKGTHQESLGFIYSRCKKDHLFSPNKTLSPKMKSLYARDFPKENFKTDISPDKTKELGKYKN